MSLCLSVSLCIYISMEFTISIFSCNSLRDKTCNEASTLALTFGGHRRLVLFQELDIPTKIVLRKNLQNTER